MIRLILADDHEVVRHGLKRIVEEHPDLRIVGEAASGEEALHVADTVPADVLLLDITMPGPGVEAVILEMEDRHPDVRILVLSVHPEEQFAVRMLRAGAHGYVSKSKSVRELAEAIRLVHRGDIYVSPTMTAALAELVRPGAPTVPEEALSPRERQILRLLGRGLSAKSIAADLGLSPKTVAAHRSRIRAKLGITSNALLIRFAVERGLVD